MKKMKMESTNMVDKRIDIIQRYFPNCITESLLKSGGGRLPVLLTLNY